MPESIPVADFNKALRERMHRGGRSLVSTGMANGGLVLRLLITNSNVDTPQVDNFFQAVIDTGRELLAEQERPPTAPSARGSMSENEYTLTQKEAADVLNVSTKSISRYRKRGLPHKLLLNPLTGKQEVRFRQADLERWDEGRQLLATYARDGEQAAAAHTRPVRSVSSQAEGEALSCRFIGRLQGSD